jgi:dTMP kinase
MINQSLFISVEGADGAGKTTACQELKELFESRGREVLLTRQPGGTELTAKIREILVNEDPTVEAIHPKAQIFLFLADRIQHIHHTILPALAQGKVVIIDRFIDSTMVFQGLMKGQSKLLHALYDTPGFELLKLRPDHTIFLDVSREDSIKRSAHRGLNGLDRIHQENKKDITQIWREHVGNLAAAYWEEKDVNKIITVKTSAPNSYSKADVHCALSVTVSRICRQPSNPMNYYALANLLS